MSYDISYCLIDGTDPYDEFECDGDVLKTFFGTSVVINHGKSLALIRRKTNIENILKPCHGKPFNIFHI